VYDGNASKASITPHHRLAEGVAAIEKELEKEIEAYNAALDANDAAEEGNDDDWRNRPGGEEIAYRCPNGKLLKPTQGRKINTGGRVEIRYVGLHWPTRQMMVLGETQRLTKIIAQSRSETRATALWRFRSTI